MNPRDVRSRDDLLQLAMVDPIAAYGLMAGIKMAPVSMNAIATFNNTTPGLPIESALDTQIDTRTWIDNFQYTISQPNSFAGQVFKKLYDNNLRMMPGVSVKIELAAGPRYTESLELTPLENVQPTFASRWPNGWIVEKLQTLQFTFQITEAPNSTPYVVTATMNGWQFLDPRIDHISRNEAARCLKNAGIDLPEICCVAPFQGMPST